MNQGNKGLQPPTPTEVLKLITHLHQCKPFAICALLECSQQQSEEISRAFDSDEFTSALYMIQFCGDQSIAQAVQNMKAFAI